MDEKTFNDGLKLLKRFLKDKGLYQQIFVNYLFKDNRPIIDLFNEFNSKFFSDVDDWRVLFKRNNLMVGKKNIYSFDTLEWVTIISNNNIENEWADYYEKYNKI